MPKLHEQSCCYSHAVTVMLYLLIIIALDFSSSKEDVSAAQTLHHRFFNVDASAGFILVL